MTYGHFRSVLIMDILNAGLTPRQVAARLQAAQGEHRQIDALEIYRLRDLGERWDGERPPEAPEADMDDQPEEADLWDASRE